MTKTTNPTLSPTQLDLRDAMLRGVVVHYMRWTRWYPAYYFRADTHKPCTAAAEALIRKGYAKPKGDGWNASMTLALTSKEPPK